MRGNLKQPGQKNFIQPWITRFLIYESRMEGRLIETSLTLIRARFETPAITCSSVAAGKTRGVKFYYGIRSDLVINH